MDSLIKSHFRQILLVFTFMLLGGLVILFLSLTSALANSPEAGNQKLYLSVDYAHFRGDTSKAFVEIYYSFGVGQLHFTKEGDKFTSAAKLDVKILAPRTDSVVFRRNWKVPYVVNDTTTLERNKSLVGVLGVWLRPSQYILRMTGVDANEEKNRDSLDFSLNLRLFPADSIALSDVELCSSIQQIPADTANIFYKNTLEVIPNPSVLYGAGLPIIFYYLEVYNLLSKVKDGEYAYTASVHDAGGNEVLSQHRTKKRVHNSSVEVGTINIGKLRSGTYSLRFSLNDSLAQQNVFSTKKFFVYNPGVKGTPAQAGTGMRGDYMASEYALMSEQDLHKEFEYLRYIALEDETKRFDNLTDLEGKR
ncbi:MAG: hypothetical protein AABZ61_04585, partial [Bacteroidota bacterium]